MKASARTATNQGALGVLGLLAVAIGGQIGVGWITFVGYWLGGAGAVSTLLGFALGAVMMAGVAACHAELAGMMPISGGEIVYAHRVFGRLTAFVVGWCLLFMAVAILSFEAVSLGWMLETLFPALKAPALFHFLGADVTLPELIIAQVSIWSVYAVNRLGLRASARTGELLTLTKVGIVACLVLGGLLLGQPAQALMAPRGSTPVGLLWGTLSIFAATPFWVGGFSSIAKLVGDRDDKISMQTVGVLMVATVIISALIYMGIVLACAAAAPVDRTVHAQLPAVFAADALFKSQWAGRAILIAGIAGILSIMNAVLLASSRVLRVFGELGGGVDAAGTSSVRKEYDFTPIVVAVSVCAMAGRGALMPFNNTGAMAAIICYFVMCLATLWLRLKNGNAPRPFKTPGGVPLLAAILVAIGCTGIFLLVQPLFAASAEAAIEWVIFGGWVAIGLLVGWRVTRVRAVAETSGPVLERAADAGEARGPDGLRP